jgi:phosphoglycerate dehydrogenase-like enzyme
MASIYIADSSIRAEQVEAIRAELPAGWTLADGPQGADAILTENAPVSAELQARAGASLKLVLRLDTGSAAIDAGSAPVVELSNTGLIGVAEHVVTLILALSRRLLWVTAQSAKAAWVEGKDTPILTDQRKYTYNWIGLPESGAIYRKKVGIVGLGHIGQAVAKRLRPFGVQLLYTDLKRLDPAQEAALGVKFRPLDDLLRESDFVTLHLRFQEGPDGNEKMFSTREFGLMKQTAYFINTSRGRMVDEDALAAALREGQIGGAGLDVFRYEPLPKDHPLLALAGDQVLLTAHTAGAYNPESWHTTAVEVVERVQEALRA